MKTDIGLTWEESREEKEMLLRFFFNNKKC